MASVTCLAGIYGKTSSGANNQYSAPFLNAEAKAAALILLEIQVV
jgi:hypothetical protein